MMNKITKQPSAEKCLDAIGKAIRKHLLVKAYPQDLNLNITSWGFDLKVTGFIKTRIK